MTNRQYIGARYVPKLVGAWQADTFYEALSIVTDNNVSYTSKKPVPATVGSPAQNPEYWVATGNYNAQMQQIIEDMSELSGTVSGLSGTVTDLSGEVSTIKSALTPLAETSLIMIGDSYAHTTDGTITKFYPQIVGENLGLDSNHFKWSGNDGAGFGNGRYLTQLQTIVGAMTATEKNNVSDVMICGGWNDTLTSLPEGTDAAFALGIGDMNTYVKANLPNAKVTIAVISWSNPIITQTEDNYTRIKLALKRYSEACGKYGWRFIENSVYILHTYASDVWQSDGFHPKQAGQDLLGSFLTEAFVSGHCDILREELVEVGNYYVRAVLHNGVCSLSFSPKNYDVTPHIALNSVTLDVMGQTPTNLLDISTLTFIKPCGYRAQISTSGMLATSSAAKIGCAYTFTCAGNTLQGFFLAAASGATLENVTVVAWNGGTFIFNSLEC